MQKKRSDPKTDVAAMPKYLDLKLDLRIKNNFKLRIRLRGIIDLSENSSSTCTSYSTDGSTSIMYGTDCSNNTKNGSTSTMYGTDCSNSNRYRTDYITSTYIYTVCT